RRISARSRTLHSNVTAPAQSSYLTISAAYMLAYAAQPCAHCRYQPRPALTPIISATTSTAKDEPSPMNRPTKTCGNAAGIATFSTRKDGFAPSVRETQLWRLRQLATPHQICKAKGKSV